MSVKFFVSDMSNIFKSVRDRFFRSSIHIIDRYHCFLGFGEC
ncbi:hypothetical protein HMPREF9129_1994 [Peptoniphilus indolicus ATCC 29427]|uniref:Uncharacterized protein n=1 Tax=Peptoniphilus indolicus ATCC 29427 TaxID=997350 RepID=G4D6G4_9FIRM|nr:hypothetical protein HMPREF9129_1994 [Peptoniphilus indolicus ATCC 29427]